MPKQARLSGIKAARCYTIDEAAEIVGVTPRTIRNWARAGLPLMDCSRPALVRGDDLRDHIKRMRAARKVEMAIDTFYCLACREARRVAGNFADCSISGNRATLTALCDVCGTLVNKHVAEAKVPEIERLIELTIKRQ